MPFTDLSDKLGIAGEQHLKALRRRLQKLVSSGRLLINRKAEYCLLDRIDVVTGRVSGHADGYGFLVPDDGSADLRSRGARGARTLRGTET